MRTGWDKASLDARPLQAAERPSSYEVHLAAVEYALSNAIIIRDADDIQSTRHWSDTLKPFHHQVRNLMTFCRRAPVALFADDVGLGKTISAGLVLSELMTRGKVQRALVVCPAILKHQWKSELKQKLGIRSVHESGKALVPHLEGNAPVVITTYHTASRYIDDVRAAGFDMLILDEAHKLKSLFGQPKPARMAVRLHQALADHVFKYALMLTATPIQNTAWDLYSLIDALAVARHHENPFGDPKDFEREYLMHVPGVRRRGKPKYLRPDKREQFRRVVSEYMVRASRRTANLPFPDRTVRLRKVRPRDAENAMLALLQKHVDDLRAVETLNLALTMMSSPAAFANQMENMAERRSWLAASARSARRIADDTPAGAKLPTLVRFLQELRRERGDDFRAVVFTNRRATQKILGKALKARGIRVGYIHGANSTGNQRTIEDFQRGSPDVNVIVSTDAGAEGVNLQVANVLVNYDLPWNPMTIEQRVGRIQRLGSDHASVIVVNLVVKDSLEERVVSRLIAKFQTITNALGDVEAILEAASRGSDDEDSFEREIGNLVMRSLREQPVEEKLQKIEANIESAQAEYEREQAFVDETLGEDLDAMHAMGPRMPPLELVVPRMDIPVFVRAAYEADGAMITSLDGDRLKINAPGQQTFVATFDRHDPELRRPGRLTGVAGANVRLFEQGSRPFEQLVGSWTQRRVHLTHDLARSAPTDVDSSLRTWLQDLGDDVELIEHDVESRTQHFRGTVSLRASVAVAHDRLERIVDLDVGDADAPTGTGEAPQYRHDLAPADLDELLNEKVADAVANQPDLARFASFYDERGREEASKRSSKEQRRQIQQNFSPRFAGELQAARGIRSETLDVTARIAFQGEGPYATRLRLRGGRVVNAPKLETCAATGRAVPSDVLVACAVTGRPALPHAMIVSEASGRRGLPSEERTCAVTRRVLLSDEVETSAVSGLVAATGQFRDCPVTKQRLLTSELVACDFSGALVAPSALVESDVSGRMGRSDQMVTSAVSGSRGHETELARCQVTEAWVLPEETAVSDVTGLRIRSDELVPVAKHPEMRAHASELVECTLSAKMMLERDTETSAVSGNRADRELMERSDKSGRYALPDEFLFCTESGARLLPDETARCDETHALVDPDMLVRNDYTGTMMIGRLLFECPETGRHGRKSDLVLCEATGTLVDPDVTTICTQTDQRVLTRLTAECAECGRPLLRDAATRTYLHEPVHPDHAGRCLWTGQIHRSSELGRCSLTNAPIAKELLGPDGRAEVFARLEELRRSRAKGLERHRLKTLRATLANSDRKASRAWTIAAPSPQVVAVLFEERRALGLQRNLHGCFMDAELTRVIG